MAVIPAHAIELLDTAREHWSRSEAKSLSGKPIRTLTASPQRTVNPYWDLALTLPLHERRLPVPGSGLLVEALPPPHGPFGWWVLQRRLAWALPSPGDLDWVLEQLAGRPVLDLGAGLGYWAWQLAQLGVDVLATDVAPSEAWLDDVEPFHPVDHHPADPADHPERALLLSWPPSGGLAGEALRAYTGDTVIYLGELNPDICGGTDFFAELDRNWTLLGHSPWHVNLYGCRGVLRAYRSPPDA
ncbi:methyltransferase domain-containing protein [Allokutzneria albata]|uniref:Methyltransferase domain-containing protein n=1 Tax=Allokutzneria albata TaxID=211114 RepID=A0A1G9SBL9_ALLAB|nr:hypothetical protein [Allokutzneria albata]SDM32782.1 hypothetical protein SAMN04489726_1043 [Allokutzneria albata]